MAKAMVRKPVNTTNVKQHFKGLVLFSEKECQSMYVINTFKYLNIKYYITLKFECVDPRTVLLLYS